MKIFVSNGFFSNFWNHFLNFSNTKCNFFDQKNQSKNLFQIQVHQFTLVKYHFHTFSKNLPLLVSIFRLIQRKKFIYSFYGHALSSPKNISFDFRTHFGPRLENNRSRNTRLSLSGTSWHTTTKTWGIIVSRFIGNLLHYFLIITGEFDITPKNMKKLTLTLRNTCLIPLTLIYSSNASLPIGKWPRSSWKMIYIRVRHWLINQIFHRD